MTISKYEIIVKLRSSASYHVVHVMPCLGYNNISNTIYARKRSCCKTIGWTKSGGNEQVWVAKTFKHPIL